jgi:DDB1-and CUL4-substrate receptor 15, WD repeat
MRGCRLRNLASWLSVRERGRAILRQPFSEVNAAPHASNVQLKHCLAAASNTARPARCHAQVPESLQIPVDSIIDEHEHLKGAVILGWTHSGSCLISYTSSPVPAADGKEGHHVQVPDAV